jgi:glycine/D-amino acid oxidase-like deaminating enzyme
VERQRIAIVGGGVIGLLTAVECVSAGHDVVLVDRADIPCGAAASHDRHRVIRALHLDDPAAAGAAVRAHERWLALQRLLSTTFYEQVGALTALPAADTFRARAVLAAAGSGADVLDPDELRSTYPHVGFPVGASAVLERRAGVLLADRVLAACAGWLRRHPRAVLYPHRRAVGVAATGIRLADGAVLSADSVLLAAGPWSRDLLEPRLADRLVLRRQSMLYCAVPAADARAWTRTPPILSLGADGGAWLVPPVVGTPLKLSAATACRVVAGVGDHTTPPPWREHLLDTFTRLIPGFGADWLIGTRDCYYLARADTGGPMLAVLDGRVVSYAACGGSSFKFAPLIARSLAARLTGADPAPTGLDPLDGAVVRPTAEPTL